VNTNKNIYNERHIDEFKRRSTLQEINFNNINNNSNKLSIEFEAMKNKVKQI
jgi:hypothetical protein